MSENDNPDLAAAQAAIEKGDWNSLGALFGETSDLEEAEPGLPSSELIPSLNPKFNLKAALTENDIWGYWERIYLRLGMDPKNADKLEKARQELIERGIPEHMIEYYAAIRAGAGISARENRVMISSTETNPEPEPTGHITLPDGTGIKRETLNILREIDRLLLSGVPQYLLADKLNRHPRTINRYLQMLRSIKKVDQ